MEHIGRSLRAARRGPFSYRARGGSIGFSLTVVAFFVILLATAIVARHNVGTASALQETVTVTIGPGRDAFGTIGLTTLRPQTGTATLSDTLDGLQVTINIEPYSGPAISQLVHIHTGQCPDVGGIAFSLTPVVSGQSTTVFGGVTVSFLQTGDFAINVHDAIFPGRYVSCGNILALPLAPAPNAATPIATPMPEQTPAPTSASNATPTSASNATPTSASNPTPGATPAAAPAQSTVTPAVMPTPTMSDSNGVGESAFWLILAGIGSAVVLLGGASLIWRSRRTR